jgi:hypothetical protein
VNRLVNVVCAGEIIDVAAHNIMMRTARRVMRIELFILVSLRVP